jgi:bifunctional non-homologous end joining protein LigD
MSALAEYRRKRDFGRTQEPAGERPRKHQRDLIFVVQLHHARARHYDFRLELDGVLKSWAVPKGPSLDPSVKRLAVQVEDHPLDYATFAGDIPAGNYGAGHVDIFDHGTWTSSGDAHAQLKKGHLEFSLTGAKLKGAWHLVRTHRHNRQPEWLLIKQRDAYAAALEADDMIATVAKAPRSSAKKPSKAVARARIAKLSNSLKAIVKSAQKSPCAVAGPVRQGAFKPQLTRLALTPPSGDDWVHEAKWDGYRLLTTIARGVPTLWSRNAIQWTQRLPAIAASLTELGLDSAQFDGELIALVNGYSDFGALQAALSGEGRAPLVYVLFDLVHLQGWALAGCPLVQRKEILRKILNLHKVPNLMFSQHHRGQGAAVFDQATASAMEGIVSKRADSPYRAGRGDDWRKIKRALSDEFAIVGYTLPKGSRSGFGSLLLAAAEPDGSWRYAGRVGSGFSQSQLTALARELRTHARSQPSVRAQTIDPLLRSPHWVSPRKVAEVYYRGIGNLGLLRQPSLKTIREDKTPADLLAESTGSRRRESAMSNKVAKAAPKKKSASAASSKPPGRKGKTATGNPAPVNITHPERVVFPADGYTKRDVADFYTAVMPWLLAGIMNRPLSVVRCPDGLSKACFFQKHLTPGLKHVRSVRLKEESGTSGNYLFVDNAQGVLDLVQFNALEFHPWAATATDPNHADYIVFDLDPAPDVPWARVAAAALTMRSMLDKVNLKSFLRTTGGKGLHVVVPLKPAAAWTQAKDFAHAFAESLAAAQPEEFIAVAAKNRRRGKIFIDYLRNARGATSVASYSLRARPGATVATPLRWNELGDLKDGAAFDIRSVPARLKRLRTDPWSGFDTVQQNLEAVGHSLAEPAARRRR